MPHTNRKGVPAPSPDDPIIIPLIFHGRTMESFYETLHNWLKFLETFAYPPDRGFDVNFDVLSIGLDADILVVNARFTVKTVPVLPATPRSSTELPVLVSPGKEVLDGEHIP